MRQSVEVVLVAAKDSAHSVQRRAGFDSQPELRSSDLNSVTDTGREAFARSDRATLRSELCLLALRGLLPYA